MATQKQVLEAVLSGTTINANFDLTQLIARYKELHTLKQLAYKLDADNEISSADSVKMNPIIQAIEDEIDRIDMMPVLKIGMETGTVWLNVFYSLGSTNDDLMEIIDGYATEGNTSLRRYETSDILTGNDDDDAYIEDSFLAINGGEFYVDTVHTVDEITFYTLAYTILELSF